MTDQNRVHWSFWVIGVIALIWNLLGVMNFFMQMNPESVAATPEPYRTAIENRPGWATAAFGVAVFGGALGCLLLLLRKSAAIYVLLASVIGVVVQMIPYLSIDALGPFEIGMMLFTLGVSIFLLWYAKRSRSKGWIN